MLLFYLTSSDNLKIFSDNSFDAVFCNMAFQLFKKPEKSLSEMFRVLKKGGEVIINFNIEKSPVWVQQEILYNQYYGNPNKKVTKVKKINDKKFFNMAEKTGFSKVSVSIKNDIYFYQLFGEMVDMMDVSFFSKDKKLNKKQEINLNRKLKKYLESTRTPKGVPGNWKILFAKLVK